MIYRVASLVAFLTIISKVLGLARDLVITHYFGTSVVSDAFNMAYMFTGNFFIIFGCIGGPFYSSVVAILPKYEKENVWRFIREIIWKTTLILSFITLGIYLFKTWILKFFINPAEQTEYFNITLMQIDVLLPLVLLCGSVGIISAVLNCYKRYVSPSLSPAMVNVALIAAVLMMGDTMNGLALALGTSIGAVLSVLMQIPSLYKIKKDLSVLPEITISPSPLYNQILIPTLFSTGLNQIMLFIDGYFCNGLEAGSLTAITLANRMIQMPMGILLTAILVPLFPRISKLVSEANITEVKRLLSKALSMLVLLSIPAVIIGTLFSQQIISIIFERGAFDARSTLLVGSTFFYFCLSIIPYIFKDCYARTCYSFGDSTAPLVVTIICIIVKIISNYLLVPLYGANGIAISTGIVSLVGAVILFFVVRKHLAKA